jgi:hypothetical protein
LSAEPPNFLSTPKQYARNLPQQPAPSVFDRLNSPETVNMSENVSQFAPQLWWCASTALRRKVLTGSYCNICGERIGTDPDVADRRCDTCKEQSRSSVEINFLMDAALSLQERFPFWLRQAPENQEMIMAIYSDPELSPAATRRLERSVLLRCTCRYSLIYMVEEIKKEVERKRAQTSERHLGTNTTTAHVGQVGELELGTQKLEDGYAWQHFVHQVGTLQGNCVMDLSGAQFGPEWPLLQPSAAYLQKMPIRRVELPLAVGYQRSLCGEPIPFKVCITKAP